MTHLVTDPIVITYENEDTNTFSGNFFESLKNTGWNYIRVGMGEKWNGYMTKVRAYLSVCDKFDAEQVLIFSDARDVLAVRPPKAFSEAFAYFKSDIIVSGEIFCDGKTERPDDYIGYQCVSLFPYFKANNMTTPIRKFVNSGLIAGKASHLKLMWAWIIDKGFDDDQLGVGSYMNTFPHRIRLDYDAELLHTTTFGVNAGIQRIHYQKIDSPSFAELNGIGSFFLHIPGINHSKGQMKLYNLVIDYLLKCSEKEWLGVYKYKTPGWDDYKMLK
jgi:hypothetical protein